MVGGIYGEKCIFMIDLLIHITYLFIYLFILLTFTVRPNGAQMTSLLTKNWSESGIMNDDKTHYTFTLHFVGKKGYFMVMCLWHW